MTYSVSGATSKDSHPLREDVSWNNDWNIVWVFVTSHPLREDVSWNTEDRNIFSALEVILFVRMWVEILSPHLHILYAVRVILFVRMWVEITKTRSFSLVTRHPLREDVSWNTRVGRCWNGCGCHPLREDVSWNVMFPTGKLGNTVILFVRMWVEMWRMIWYRFVHLSSSSWGCELKFKILWL